MKLLKPIEYSRKHNIPYRTVRSWIARGKINVVRKIVEKEVILIKEDEKFKK